MLGGNKNIGFATATQRKAMTAGGNKAVPEVIASKEEDKDMVEKINEAVEKYDEYMKKFLEQYIEQKFTEMMKDYMGNKGFKDRKITDTPTDDYGIPNRKFVAAGSQPGNPVKGQSYNDGSKQQFWTGSAWVTWT